MSDAPNLRLQPTPQVHDTKCKYFNEGSDDPMLSNFKPQLGRASNQIDETYQEEYKSDSSMSTVELLYDSKGKMAKLHSVYLKKATTFKQQLEISYGKDYMSQEVKLLLVHYVLQ